MGAFLLSLLKKKKNPWGLEFSKCLYLLFHVTVAVIGMITTCACVCVCV